MVHYEIIFGMF